MIKQFNGFGAFAEHLIVLGIAQVVVQERGLKKVLIKLERDAKDEIGHYQQEAGTFPAWAPLAQSTEDDKAARGYPLNAPLLRSGDLRGSITHEQHGYEGVMGSTSDIAVYQELGTSTIPPRPFIGPAAFRSKKMIERELGKAVTDGILYGATGAWTTLED